MTAARADLRDLPDWPRLLSREQAAAYLGVSVNMLESRAGNMWPEPIRVGKRKLWDRKAIDHALDLVSGFAAPSGARIVREAFASENARETRQ